MTGAEADLPKQQPGPGPAQEVVTGTAAEPGPAAQAAAPPETAPEDLVRLLEEARSQVEQSREALLRAHAEMENLRKRHARDLDNAHRFGLERIVADLLPVKDSIELGLAAASESVTDPEKLREGLELTLKMLANALEKYGVSEVDPKGARFDPERHQAMTVQEGAGAESGSVLMVVQKGYTLNDRLVRPAMVVVAK
jgi:molecular chaperone GrpE